MEGAKERFDLWELRCSIMLGIVLQILLMLWPNLQKLSTSCPSLRVIWLVFYLAIDFFTTLTLGIIFRLNMDPRNNHDQNPQNKYLLALWALVVLLHLGSHSTVTAFSLADNEFWFSHIIRFMYHELMALAICVLAFKEKRLRFPSIVFFTVSTFKFGERVWALKRGSMDEVRRSNFKDLDPGPDIMRVIRIASRYMAANRAGNVEYEGFQIDMPRDQNNHPIVQSPSTDVQYLCAAYQSFKKHKHLYTGDLFTCEQGGDEPGRRFSEMGNYNRSTLVEIELNFAYDLFYTKREFLHSTWGWFLRITLLVLIFGVLGVFAVIHKIDFLESDVSMTYNLLSITLFLEVVSFLQSLSSNHTLVKVGFQRGQKWRILEGMIFRLWMRTRRGIFPRRSISIGQFSLLSFCFKDYRSSMWPKQVISFFELKAHWDNYWYTSYLPLDDHDDELKNHVFDQVESRIEEEQNLDENHKWFVTPISPSVSDEMPGNAILEASTGWDFEKCVVIWHVATDLCYRTSIEPHVHLQNAKRISENILYLLKVHPSMLSSITTTELKSYNHMCTATTQLFSDYRVTNDGVEVYNILEDVFTIVSIIPEEQRARDNLLLLDGFKLAREFMILVSAGEGNVWWELMLKVWIDILSYAAFHSQGKHHAERLGSGGEFLTHVWLFMHHLIVGSCYQI